MSKFIKILFLFSFCLFLFGVSMGVVTAADPHSDIRANIGWPTSPLGTYITVYSDWDYRWTWFRGMDWVEGDVYRHFFREDIDIPIIVRYFYEWMIVLGGLAAFIAFIWAGLLYMTSVGDANKMGDAKKKITRALIGLVLLLGSYIIFYLINPELTRLGRTYITMDETLDPAIQDQIKNFVKVYNQCVAEDAMDGVGIHIPLPIIGAFIPISRLLGFGRLTFDPHYTSFIPETTASNCTGALFRGTGLRGIIKAEDDFPKIESEIRCIYYEGEWKAPYPLPFLDKVMATSYDVCRNILDDNRDWYFIKVKHHFLFDGRVISNYNSLIAALGLDREWLVVD